MTLGGLLMGLAETYALATTGRVIAGVGGVIINVLLTKMVADWFAGREMMAAMALFVNSWPVGIGLGLLTLGPLAASAGWPLVMHFTAAICVIALVLVALFYRPPADAAKPTRAGSLPSMFRLGFTGRELTLVLLAGTLWPLFNVGFILMVSFAPDYLAAAGHSRAYAGFVVSIATWCTIVMGPMGGFLAERSGRPGMILTVSLVGLGAAVGWVTVWDAPVLLFAIMGIFGGLAPGIIMALPARAVREEVLAPAIGLYFTCNYAGMALLPTAAGWLRDATGQVSAPLLFAAGTLCAALLTFVVFARLARN